MIGQKTLLESIDNLIQENKFPKFSIIWGSKGSGKKELCKYIAESLNVFWCYEPDCKVDTVRNAIWDAYKVYSPTLYIFADADNMSIQAKNSLLKVTEEPPRNAYFIMTLEDINNALPTIRSRAVSFQMNSYSVPELLQYYAGDAKNNDIIANICETPGEVDYLKMIGPDTFYDFVTKVFDNIALVNGANSFKIGLNLCLKENTPGYDLKLFLKAFKCVCWDAYLDQHEDKYKDALEITSQALQKCSYKSINRQMVFDTWILSIRGVWM